jgi:LuxR family quorum-sensing system transcriptional regulator CciR
MVARLNWDFALVCDRAEACDEVEEVLVGEMRALGFAHVACGSHVDPLHPPPGAVMMLDYPDGWAPYFSDQGFALRDPVFATARRQVEPFAWSDQRFRASLDDDQKHIMAAAADAGLVHGYTIPIHAPDAWAASCSLVAGNDNFDPQCVRAAHWYALYAHEAARRIESVRAARVKVRLHRRERECVEWFARGKTDAETAIILGVSEHTVRNTVRRVMERYGVGTRMQAFVRALADREIALEDVAD